MARTRKASLKGAAAEAEKAQKEGKVPREPAQNPVHLLIRVARAKRSVTNRREKTPSSMPSAPQSPVADTLDNEVDNEVGDGATAVLILLGKEYELQTFVYLDKERITSMHQPQKLNKFNFQSFLAESIKTTAQRTQSKEDLIQWSRGEAEALYTRLPAKGNAVSDVYDGDDWKRVENTIKGWMMAHKDGIRVTLSLYFKKKAEEVAPMPKMPENTSNSGSTNVNSSSNSTGKPPKVTLYLKTSTNCRLARQRKNTFQR
jgi:hypothetical protein